MTTALSGVRQSFENMEQRNAEVVARFGVENQSPKSVHDIVKDLPLYAGRRYSLSKGMEEFLDAMPFMAKPDLRRHFPQGFLRPGVGFASLVASKKVEVVRTSGTSSDRLQVLWDADWWERQELAALRSHPHIAPHLNHAYREIVLTTPLCSESVCKTGPASMDERRIDHLLFLNTQHDPSRWSVPDLSRMAAEIEEFKPVAMEADPVYLAALARYIRDNKRPAPGLKWIILTYEFVSLIDKHAIHAVFGCPVFEFYGLTEAGVFFLECPRGRHHFCGSDSAVEILRPRDSALAVKLGEVFVTTWGNTAEPLLRYRTGDLVTMDNTACSCGIPGPVIASFEGRLRDVIEFPDGSAFTPRQIDIALFGTKGLAQYMCVHDQPESVRVDYVFDASAGAPDPGDEIHSRLRSIWGKIAIHVRRVPFITPEQSGKYRTTVPR